MRLAVVLFLVTAVVVALPCNDYRSGANGAIGANTGAEYNDTLVTFNGSAISNGTCTSPGNRESTIAVDYDYGRCGHGFGRCETSSCCSEHGLVFLSSTF